MNKVQIDAKQAGELMVKGYEVECYLIIPPVLPVLKTHKPTVAGKALLTISLEGKEPLQGHIAEIWPKVKKQFWSDPSKVTTRAAVEKWVMANGGVKNHVSQFIHAYKCLRVVAQK